MRNLSWLVSFGLLLAACGGVTSDPQSSDTHAVSGEKCTDMGATAPAMDGCNSCTCTEDGWACTKEACPTTGDCIDGETKADSCNTCSCSDGSWVCTDIGCPPVDLCTEGTVKDAGDNCNECICNSDGAWSCTRKACTETCTAGDTKPADDGCNTCGCTDEGQWACTLIACDVPGDDVDCPAPSELPPDTACVDAVAYGRAPDTGTCCLYPTPCQVPSGWTSFYTLEECEGDEAACEPGATKDDGCNTCTCTDDGTWLCTEKACPTEVGCGGWLGDTCSASEYCAYEEGQHCGAADASSVCKPRPDGCTLDYTPVCGCDGKTYSNACVAATSGTGVNTEGACAGG